MVRGVRAAVQSTHTSKLSTETSEYPLVPGTSQRRDPKSGKSSPLQPLLLRVTCGTSPDAFPSASLSFVFFPRKIKKQESRIKTRDSHRWLALRRGPVLLPKPKLVVVVRDFYPPSKSGCELAVQRGDIIRVIEVLGAYSSSTPPEILNSKTYTN